MSFVACSGPSFFLEKKEAKKSRNSKNGPTVRPDRRIAHRQPFWAFSKEICLSSIPSPLPVSPLGSRRVSGLTSQSVAVLLDFLKKTGLPVFSDVIPVEPTAIHGDVDALGQCLNEGQGGPKIEEAI